MLQQSRAIHIIQDIFGAIFAKFTSVINTVETIPKSSVVVHY